MPTPGRRDEGARELGAQGIGLCRTEHMFFGEERLPVVQEMILADDEAARRAALDRLLPFQSDFEGIFEAMAGLPVTIRLLDPPLHEFSRRSKRRPSECGTESRRSTRRTRCWGRAAAGSVCNGPRSTRCRSEQSCALLSRCVIAPVRRRWSRSCTRLVAFAEELRRLHELTVRVAAEEGCDLPYLIGTMIELPRACMRADGIAGTRTSSRSAPTT